MTRRTEQAEKDCQDRAVSAWYCSDKIATQGRTERRGQPEKNSYNPTARTAPRMRQPEQDSQIGTTRQGQSDRDNQTGTAR